MKKYLFGAGRTLVALVFALSLAGSAWAAGLEYVTAEGRGSGETRAKAIAEALAEAVARVNGLSLASQDVSTLKTQLSSAEVQTNTMSASAATATLQEEMQKRISTATKGLVQSYDVISESPSATQQGWVDVTVQATIGRYRTSEQANRKRIAVMPFRVRSGAAPYEARYAELAAQAVVDYLSQTRRFSVLDRNFLREKHAEFNLLQGDDVPAAEKARVGNTLGTDYIVVGSVDTLSGERKQEKIPYLNEYQHAFTVRARLAWRVIEAPTGMVMLSDTVTETQVKKITATTADAELPGVTSLADATARRIGQRIMDSIYPLMPVAFSGASLTIGQGGDTLKVGQRFDLILYGEILRDPYTKEPLGREEKKVGLVEVESVLPKTSQAKVIECSIKPEDFAPGKYILRETKADPAATAKPAPAPTMKPKW